jgi:Leucine-rich repeat (LRR) protein
MIYLDQLKETLTIISNQQLYWKSRESSIMGQVALRCKMIDDEKITYRSWDDLMEDAENIIELDCSKNNLTKLPESIGNLTRLRKLNCSINKLSSLPASIENLTQLHDLRCYSNQLTMLPVSIGNLTQLEQFNCSFNPLKTLPKSIGNLTQLQNLILQHTQLTVLPDSVGNLIQLKEFDISQNKLTALPESIGNFTQLKDFDCSFNQLTTLPESIGNFTQLHVLWCNFNQLKTLPESIGNLTQLRSLLCNSNQLTTLPLQLMECRKLRYITIELNPIEMIPVPLQRAFKQRALDYMRNVIYNDEQNIHSTSIQASVKQSIYNLLNDRSIPDLSDDQLRELIVALPPDLLSDETKSALLEYMASSEEHSTLAITFSDLFKKVIGRMEKSDGDVRKDLYQRLNEEMVDAECKCFTGRLSRLVNVLVGFFDDIRIEISGAEQISIVIALVKARHLIGDEDEVSSEIKEEIRRELQERGYEANVIEEWLVALE